MTVEQYEMCTACNGAGQRPVPAPPRGRRAMTTEPVCNGICLMGNEVLAPTSGVRGQQNAGGYWDIAAVAHPDCERHGTPCLCDAGSQGAESLELGPHHDDDCERFRPTPEATR